MASVGIGNKRRRDVNKVSQNTSNVYSSSKSKSSDYTLAKHKGIDKLQGIKEEKRGRSNKGDAKHTYKTTGQKQKSRSSSNKSKAKRGGK